MLDRVQLALAIDIQARSYQLLRWIREQIDKGLIAAGQAANHADSPDPALAWIREFFPLFPKEARPDPAQMPEFAAFFWTYLLTSFDIVEKPGTRLVSFCGGCRCPLCSRIENAPHLAPKKLTQRDKLRAVELMIERMEQLALEEAISIAPGAAGELLNDPEMRRAAGYSAYGFWLINRMHGITDGPSILALWREIAWTKLGSPIKGFKLLFEDFVDAENRLILALRDLSLNAPPLKVRS